MTSLPANASARKLGLVIDLDICVGCHACAVNCKEWNSGGHSAPMTDLDPYGADPWGVWFNRIHALEAGDGAEGRTVYFPKSCLHCEEPACVTVCPTGASYKRAEDGIVAVAVLQQGGQDLLRHLLLEQLEEEDEMRLPERGPAALRRHGVAREVGTHVQLQLEPRHLARQLLPRARERLRAVPVQGHHHEAHRHGSVSG